ncbi:MAG: hypothetical protein NTW86_31830 [Candidatus Sumerlaeota bacterium]|nr:hypothetical protein [Candidatus Sumerlaeota bacterium]
MGKALRGLIVVCALSGVATAAWAVETGTTTAKPTATPAATSTAKPTATPAATPYSTYGTGSTLGGQKNPMIDKGDTDKDGALSKDEWTKLFDTLDKNKDGKIDADELKAVQPVGAGASQSSPSYSGLSSSSSSGKSGSATTGKGGKKSGRGGGKGGKKKGAKGGGE